MEVGAFAATGGMDILEARGAEEGASKLACGLHIESVVRQYFWN